MKSIKEKADEKYPIITGELQTYNEKFIDGATYVLECFEEIIVGKRVWSTEDIQKIYNCVEQLKGNQ